MASKSALKRLTKEALSLEKNPPPFIIARPLESNILEFHYVITGPPDTPYAGGQYHGKLLFPSDYPYKPPTIKMITPNGRFATNTRLCLSMSDFHPGSWNPAWSVSTILTGLLSFMLEDTFTTGSIETSVSTKKQLANSSHSFNSSNPKFRQVFPDLVTAGIPVTLQDTCTTPAVPLKKSIDWKEAFVHNMIRVKNPCTFEEKMKDFLENLLQSREYNRIITILVDLELDYNSNLQELDTWYSTLLLGVYCITRKVVEARFFIKRSCVKDDDFIQFCKISEYLASFQYKKLHLLLQEFPWNGISVLLVKHLQESILQEEFKRLSSKYTSIDPKKVSDILGIPISSVGNYVRENNWDIDAKEGYLLPFAINDDSHVEDISIPEIVDHVLFVTK